MSGRIETMAEFWAEAERIDPEGFARARAEQDELAARRKDAERLDWFAENVIGLEDDEGRGQRWKVWCGHGKFAGETIRDAIDAAMAKEPR